MPAIVGLALLYVTILVGSGSRLPFIPVWFQAQGLSGAQMAAIMAAPLFAQAVTGPALALWADSFRLRRTPLIWIAGGSTAAFGLLGLVHGFWA
jgi:PPP family 3-phenylpropionic acid transporter